MRCVSIPLFWRATDPTNLTVSRIIVFFPLSRYFYNCVQWLFPFLLSGPQDSVIFVGSVACQNSGMYTLRMIVTVAYLDTAHDFPKGSNTLCHQV